MDRAADTNARSKELAPPAVDTPAQRLAELAALVDAVKERVRAQYPDSTRNGPSGAICVGLPDLAPLARARDAAAGKMAAIGTVNPRPGGLVNNSIQKVKGMVARSLNWFVRDQVVFNRQVIACLETCLETLADVNRTIHNLAGQSNTQLQRIREEVEPLRVEARALRTKTSELQDLASQWFRWREEWQIKLHRNEVEFLKSVADLNMAVQQKFMHLESAQQHRIAEMERVRAEWSAAFEKTATELDASYRKTALQLEAEARQVSTRLETAFTGSVEQTAAAIHAQHDDFERQANRQAELLEQRTTQQIREFEQALATSQTALRNQLYSDLEHIRREYERLIHAELRVVRQRLGTPAQTAPPAAAATPVLPFDYARFADRFRGSEQYVTDGQRFYVPYFAGRSRVVDIGCGRGEFLALMKEAGVAAKGIEASAESVEFCRSRGFEAEQADLFTWLGEQAEGSLDGIFCAQVVEHLPVERLPEMVKLCASRLATGGILLIETPNPECLAIFGTHFYLDPTHTRPVPAPLLAFYMEEFGMGRIEVHHRAPAIDSMPEVGTLPESFRDRFFGGLDYGIIAVKL